MAAQIENLYRIYSQNLEILKKHPEIHVEPDWADAFICPMCFSMFNYDEIEKNRISLEHIPPKKLGGKVRTLTCKDCNNQSGTELDSQLKRRVELKQFLTGKLDRPIDIQYSFNNSASLFLNAEFSISNEGNFYIVGVPSRSNPADIEQISRMTTTKGIGNGFTIRFQTYKPNYPEAALLRVAYLWAFSVLGYCYIFHSPLEKVRQQIQKPNEKILNNWGVIEIDEEEIPDDLLGLNYIRFSDVLRGFLVVFDVKTPNHKERFCVLLPGLDLDSLNIYNIKDKFTAQITNIETKFAFTTHPYIVLKYWNNL